MKTCTYCHSYFNDNIDTCKNCGASLPIVEPSSSADPKIVQNITGNTNVYIINEAHSQIPVQTKQSENKGCLVYTPFLIVFLIIGGLIGLANMAFAPPPSPTSTSSVDSVISPEPVIDSNVERIMMTTNLSESEATAVFNDLKSVGFSSVEEMHLLVDSVPESLGYNAYCNDYQVDIVIKDKKTESIQSGGIDLFTREKGSLGQVSDCCVTLSDRDLYIRLSTKAVDDYLLAPASAEYAGKNQWKITRDKDLIVVNGYVDSENTYGAMLRSKFTVELNRKSDNISYIAINGKTVYGKSAVAKKKKS